MVGFYLDSKSNQHGFEAIPNATTTPEPSTVGVLGLGVAGLGVLGTPTKMRSQAHEQLWAHFDSSLSVC